MSLVNQILSKIRRKYICPQIVPELYLELNQILPSFLFREDYYYPHIIINKNDEVEELNINKAFKYMFANTEISRNKLVRPEDIKNFKRYKNTIGELFKFKSKIEDTDIIISVALNLSAYDLPVNYFKKIDISENKFLLEGYRWKFKKDEDVNFVNLDLYNKNQEKIRDELFEICHFFISNNDNNKKTKLLLGKLKKLKDLNIEKNKWLERLFAEDDFKSKDILEAYACFLTDEQYLFLNNEIERLKTKTDNSKLSDLFFIRDNLQHFKNSDKTRGIFCDYFYSLDFINFASQVIENPNAEKVIKKFLDTCENSKIFTSSDSKMQNLLELKMFEEDYLVEDEKKQNDIYMIFSEFMKNISEEHKDKRFNVLNDGMFAKIKEKRLSLKLPEKDNVKLKSKKNKI